MSKLKAGSFYFDENHYFEYYTHDFDTFYKENGDELSKEELEEWATWLNSPWSQADSEYTININCKDAYTQMEENSSMWKCEYSIVGYDGISASVFGYGDSEGAALVNCKERFRMLQALYNLTDIRFNK